MERPVCLRSALPCYLFIYVVRRRQEETCGYCTVLAYGRSLDAAERLAADLVHQHGLHIVRSDTATPAPWLDPIHDAEYLAGLRRAGVALRLSLPPVAATAA